VRTVRETLPMTGSSITLGHLVATGRTSRLYAHGTDSVVKVPRHGVPDEWLALEAELTAAVREAGVPAPQVRDVVRSHGRIAVVFERINGPSMWEEIVSAPDTVERRAAQLADIHRELLSVGLPERVPDLVDRTQRKIKSSTRLLHTEQNAAADLVANVARGAALLHGDLHPGNILLAADGPVIIDWFDASIGHPVADVCRSVLLMRPTRAETEHAHLPGASAALLTALTEGYRREMDPFLAPDPLVAHWDALNAAARLSEGAHVDEALLVETWQNHAARLEASGHQISERAGDGRS